MKRTRPAPATSMTPDALRLMQLAQGLSLSGCRLEDGYWEDQLKQLINQLLGEESETSLNQALEQCHAGKTPAFDALIELIETCCEHRPTQPENRPATKKSQSDNPACDDTSAAPATVMLFAAPILAWSAYAIPTGPLDSKLLAGLHEILKNQVFAPAVRQIVLADFLFSPDQLPQRYCDTARLAERLGASLTTNRPAHFDPAQMPETSSYLADSRYLLGAILVDQDWAPVFRWQNLSDDPKFSLREAVLQQWQTQATTLLRPLFAGCAFEPLLPLSFHAACRQADQQARSYSLRASITYLETVLNIAPDKLCAVIAPFHEQQLEEYRIGFTLDKSLQVIHGLVWPLLESEDQQLDLPAQIEAILRAMGVVNVIQIDHRLPVEYCDDCGSPLYPNPEGEPVHAEIPEDQLEAAPRHLH